MGLLDYTTYDEVRATLGVSDAEISDDTLALPMYSSNLNIELGDVSLNLVAQFKAVKAIDPASRTEEQQRLYEAVSLFAALTVARQCCGSLPMFGPKSISDSKTEVSRFSDSPYKETIKSIKANWELYKQRTAAALAAVLSSSTTVRRRTAMVVSSLSTDPVTG